MQALGYLDRPAAQAAQLPATVPSARPTCSWPPPAAAGASPTREDTLLKTGQAAGSTSTTWKNAWARARRAWWESAAVRVADADGIDALAYFFVAREGEQAAVEQALRERMELPHYQRPRWLHSGDHPAHRHRQDAAPQAPEIDGPVA